MVFHNKKHLDHNEHFGSHQNHFFFTFQALFALQMTQMVTQVFGNV